MQTRNTKMLTVGVRSKMVPSYSSDSEFVTAKGSSAEESDQYWNSTEKLFKEYANGAWRAQFSPGFTVIQHVTSNTELTSSDSGKVFTNKGSTQDVTITLPSSASIGTIYYFHSFSGYSFIVECNENDKIWHGTGTDYYGTELDTSAVGNTIQLLKIDTNDWIVLANYSVDATKGWNETVATVSTTLLFFCGGILASGSPTNAIDYIDAEIQGQNAVDRGDTIVSAEHWGSTQVPTYGFLSGINSASYANSIMYLYLRITTTNAFDRGDKTVSKKASCGLSDVRYGFFCGGEDTAGGNYSNVIDYVDGDLTIGDATDKGDLTIARSYSGSCYDQDYGYIGGGYTGSVSNVIDYVTLLTSSSNALDRGDLTVAKSHTAGLSSTSYGFFIGGRDATIVRSDMDYIDLSTQSGNASDRGDLNTATSDSNGGSGSSLGFCGGVVNFARNSYSSTIQGFNTTVVAGSCVTIGTLTLTKIGHAGVGGKVIS